MPRALRSGVVAMAIMLAALPALCTEPPLMLEVQRQGDALEVSFQLLEPLPESFDQALPSGAQVRVVYPVKVRVHRRLVWNKKVWQGEVTSTVSFDPVTGRYRCEVILDKVIVASREMQSAADARQWLTAPPPVRLAVPPGRRGPELLVRVRAVFSSSTKWLLFPSTEGSDWVEVKVEPTR
jgi:hypothetical protein